MNFKKRKSIFRTNIELNKCNGESYCNLQLFIYLFIIIILPQTAKSLFLAVEHLKIGPAKAYFSSPKKWNFLNHSFRIYLFILDFTCLNKYFIIIFILINI